MDLFHKLQANISFGLPQQILITCALSDAYLLQEALSSKANQPPTSDLFRQFQKNVPRVWAETNSPGLASHRTSVMVQLLATATPVQLKRPNSCLFTYLGYIIKKKKVTYLGCIIKKGNQALAPSQVQAVLQIPTPTTKCQVQEFLETVGYCRLWILGFSETAKPLYACTGGNQPLTWTELEQRVFDKLNTALTMAPALALPDISKPFRLFVHEKQGVAKGVLTQTLGPWSQPVAYLSKRLDPVASGWPAYLRSVAATALLVKEADKLTLGQELNLVTPHVVVTTPWSSGKMDVKCPHSSISGLTFGPAPHKVFKGYGFKPCHAATRQQARGAHT
ncbi:Pol polyprotein [Plecturocebus cupreus]